MSTVSSISTSGVYSYPSATNAASTAQAQSAAAKLSVINTLTSLGTNTPSPLTYNAAGLLSSFQQTTLNTSNTPVTNAQAAQNAVLQVEYAITQTLGSLVTGTSPNSSSSDISSLFSLPGTTDTSNPFGTSLGSLLNVQTGSSTSGLTSAQTAQYAVLSAQYAVTQALTSMTSNTTSNLSTTA